MIKLKPLLSEINLRNSVNEGPYDSLDHEIVMSVLDVAGQFTSDANSAANQQWDSIEDLVKYIKGDFIDQKWHKDFDDGIDRVKQRHNLGSGNVSYNKGDMVKDQNGNVGEIDNITSDGTTADVSFNNGSSKTLPVGELESFDSTDSNNIDLPANEYNLKMLTFDDVIRNFPADYKNIQFNRMQPDGNKGPYYKDSVAFSTGGGSSVKIGDLSEFEYWKQQSLSKFGNDTKIFLDPDAEWFNKVKIQSDKFDKQSNTATQAKSSMLNQWGTTT